ncbi:MULTISPECIES: hypothetical protein [Kitasatospora]|uniref:Uncharacterized protein n=1 Tax=Kitasatospora cystarginea TaxID=58350 RepID=A0ABP5S0X7_9ACTN
MAPSVGEGTQLGLVVQFADDQQALAALEKQALGEVAAGPPRSGSAGSAGLALPVQRMGDPAVVSWSMVRSARVSRTRGR